MRGECGKGGLKVLTNDMFVLQKLGLQGTGKLYQGDGITNVTNNCLECFCARGSQGASAFLFSHGRRK